jgi:hypothetical protein
MVVMLAIAVVLQLFVPFYGMTLAAWIVFIGVLNYVAYRDIFQRRSANLPQTIAAALIGVTSLGRRCRARAGSPNSPADGE